MNKRITVVGLGAGDLDQLPFGVYRLLKKMNTVYVRTMAHPVIEDLTKEGVQFVSFDEVYEKHDQFEAVYEEIASELIQKAESESEIVYAVPGHPMVAEKTVQILLEKEESEELKVTIAGGQSFIDDLFTAVKIDPIDGFQLLDGTALKKEEIHIFQHIIIAQVYDAFIASEVKLTLMEKYPDEFEVYIVTAAGSSEQVVKKVPLYELDRQVELNNLTSLYVPPVKKEEQTYKEFSVLRQTIAQLRGPNGCPWDQKQTHESLKKYLIEETYELLDAIDRQDDDHIIEELGDVLLQVMLHAQIGEDEGMFAIEDVIESITEKMIRRHPHVFGDVHVESAEEVVANWQDIKAAEKGKKELVLLDEVEKGLPALLRAHEFQKKAAKVGFDWDEADAAMEKVVEEWQEFLEEVKTGNELRRQEEFGDVLFALVNVARFYSIHPEEALTAVNEKFYRRFAYVEKKVRESGEGFEAFNLEQLDAFWNEAKTLGL
ncbi:tetrapyrrole methylase family protein/MazG family protein [Bacillus ectoiniformans]|uniref:nucleoside triphosphate pyrophosphohydrolase n=1 Tax=Bacillus ectoiniformans TaxID=1494429 RepID=UPI00195D4DEA|nr:nucleoside triphosphate pyrophosphohydrolase [Bacillus ectoiniformans]MBM7650296.1 tetrapyrrole methylase family protein/MazG family protein [Bacillus ectoiniformans]